MTFELPSKPVMLAIHKRQLERFGGATGIRDEGGIDAALARPMQLSAYSDGDMDIFRISASLLYSITKNRHPFTDGNKRVGLAMLLLTLSKNGWVLDISNEQAIKMTLAVADGSLSEADLVTYCRENSIPFAT
ncbi:type II toxin-antitoxin system death-on-curing family toxin [Sneathiella marina]|uniref:Type II toxin-antitoxin system death-on-curing family toxin n=1 Tax=Sneathiella marina TaxID=2950108 RepID=A0ABY4W2W1_9PROT|nr:type II toxin-antitoxin system death-on-curing family toxin [Sneathiella marina]USG61398.1 type II toxin-antitoxin system death-on-curing family toxin [Sneathiella marina]